MAVTGCLSPPPHAGDPEYLPDGYVKRRYEYIYKTDGSQKAKECEFECKKQETGCKQLSAIEDQTRRMNSQLDVSSIKEWDDRKCENSTIKCMQDICNAPFVKKQYLD